MTIITVFSDMGKEIMERLKEGASYAKGAARRMFMAKTVNSIGKGGQSIAEKELQWNRGTIRKGQKELIDGPISDNFSKRGRKKTEEHLPNLLEDIKSIVSPISQADPTFKTTKMYTPISAKEVRRRLIKEKKYVGRKAKKLPGIRTINNKLNELGFQTKKINKTKPIKRIEETHEIFEQVYKINEEADSTPGELRISIDTKAKVNVGPFARGGKSRQGIDGVDHDFQPDATLFPFGIFLPKYDEIYLDWLFTRMGGS